MSNDEYKTSLVNYNYNNHNNFGPAKIINFENKNFYKPLFLQEKKSRCNANLFCALTETTQNVTSFKQTDYNNLNNNNLNTTCEPMNLITNTGLDLSHSIRKPTAYNTISHTAFPSTSNFYQNTSFNLSNSNSHTDTYALSPASSSSSSSIDVENDIKDKETSSVKCLMSPVSVPTHHQQKPLLADIRNPSQSAFATMELTAGSIPSPFPLNYQQLYANNTALYGTPVMFSGAIHAAHASYMAGLPLHAALSPNETYLKAIQAAACGIYSPTALAPPPAQSAPLALIPPSASPSSSLNCKPSPPALHKTPNSNVMALAPSSSAVTSGSVVISKSPQHQKYSPNMVNTNISSIPENEQQKRNYQSVPLINSQTRLSSSNSSGTYLNDKVNERLSTADAAKDSHFKVPNGKEGSLKHRILRPPSNGEIASEANKIPVMRTYSTTSSFKKGNYIELANGALRRVEDMRTEDFIQCAERSPYHQLAESTVVKINTSLPSTAVITFSYDRNRSKVDMEISLDHPFFVYGQGWASCNPELSLKMFGLKCQRLQVGDICISLTKREQPKQQTLTSTTTSNTDTLPLEVNDAVNYQKKQTMTVSSPSAACNEMPSYSNAFTMHVLEPTNVHHLQQQQAYAEMAKLMSTYAYTKGLPQIPHEQLKEVVVDAPKMMNAFYQSQLFQYAQQQEHLRQSEFLAKNNQLQHRASVTSSGNYSVASSHISNQPTDLEQQPPPQTQPLDVTMSRKRRWSAPENMFDDDDSETQPPRNIISPAAARS